ncbi:MAG: orotidine-5-phosphate decarboxylase [Chthoniobacter sp.]|jgi:orotidine-5'-phosphate decarboxylase|nr:orotidine-5-phosphate decarboxylase [Chthoniobacter sp.]
MKSRSEKIIVALDVSDEDAAARLMEQLGERIRFYKIGLQLFTKCGPSIVRRVQKSGAKVFLDLKFHDIPNTVQHAAQSASALGVDMLTIHLCGGAQMIRAAAAGAGETLVLGVSVLTSSNRETLREVGTEAAVEDQVLRLARLALDNGVRGIVASPQEISLLRQLFARQLTIVTPGVRPAWAAANDQQRTLTPRAAVGAGADFLVIGRPITAQDNPAEAADRIIAELD